VTNDSLARSYLIKARARLKTLPVLAAEQAWSDVIREAPPPRPGCAKRASSRSTATSI
jgi:hypothetical protein